MSSSGHEEKPRENEANHQEPLTQKEAPAKAAPRRKKPRRVWIYRTLWALLALIVLARLALPFALPIVLDAAVADRGFEASYEDLDLSLLGLSVQLHGFELRDRRPEASADDAPGQRHVRLDLLAIDVDVSALLTGTLRVHRVAADGLDLRLVRDAEGRVPLLERLAGPPSSDGTEAEADPTPEETDEPEPIDLRLPLEIGEISLAHLRVWLRDESIAPALETWIEANVHARDLGVPGREAQLTALVQGDALVDRLYVEGTLQAAERELRARLTLDLDGLHPHAAASWLQAAGIEPVARDLDADLHVEARAFAEGEGATVAQFEARLHGVQLRADQREQTALEEMSLHGQQGGAAGLHVRECKISGVRGHAVQEQDGRLRVAGLRLGGPTPARAPTAKTAEAKETEAGAPLAVRVDLAELREARFAFRDETVTPAAELEFVLDELSLRELRSPAIEGEDPGRVELHARMPGVAETLELRGTLQPFGPTPNAELDLLLDEVGLAALERHLARAGLEAQDGTRRLELKVSAGVDPEHGTHAELRELRLREGERELAALDLLRLRGLRSTGGTTRIEAITLQGLGARVVRDEKGALEVLGLRTRPAEPAPERARPAAPPTEEAAAAGATPRFELGLLEVKDSGVALLDRSVAPELETGVAQLQVELRDLAFGGEQAPRTDEAKLRASLAFAGLTGACTLEGTIKSTPGPLAIDAALRLHCEGIDAKQLGPYLLPQGIEARMRDGRFAAALGARVRTTDAGMTIDAALEDVELREGEGEPFAALARASVRGLQPGREGLHIDEIAVQGPQLRVARDEANALQLLGLRFLPPSGESRTAGAPPAAPAPPKAQTQDGGSRITIDAVHVDGVRVAWRDAAIRGAPVATELQAELRATEFEFGPNARPTRLRFELRVPESVDALVLEGQATLDPRALATRMQLTGDGLRAGPLAAYLPAGVEATFEQGTLRSTLEAEFGPADGGGERILAALRDFDMRERGEEHPLLAWKDLRVHAPRLDPAGGAIHVDELKLEGTELTVVHRESGELELLGLRLAAAEPGPREVASTPAPAEASSSAPEAAPQPIPAPSRQVPEFWIDELSLELATLRVLGRGREGDAPPLLGRLRLFGPERLVLAQPEAEELPPVQLRIEGGVDPLVESLTSEITVALRGNRPNFTMELDVRGLRGEELSSRLPQLAERIDATAIPNGRLTAKLEGELELRRRDPLDFDLSRGFGLETTLMDVTLRAEPEGEVLAGIHQVYVLAPRIVPGQSTHIARLEVFGITGKAKQTPQGLHVLGLHLKPDPSGGSADAEQKSNAGATETAHSKSEGRQDGGGELRIDRLAVSGIDFDFEDTTTEPVTHAPLTGLEIEMQQFSTRAFAEPQPIRFSVSLMGGNVRLPKRHDAGSFVLGMLGSAARVVTGGSNEIEYEERPFLGEFAANGQIYVHPHLRGNVRASVGGLELLALRGIAQQSGIEIGGGVFDGGLRFDFEGEQGVDVSASLTFENLAIDEPPGGPISSYLRLPAPLNAVIFALKDRNDRIRIPLNVHVAEEGIGTGQIANALITALSRLIADAVTSAPLRVTGMVTGTLGLDSLFGGTPKPLQERKVAVTFAPAAAMLTQEARDAIAAIAELLEGDDDVGLVLVHDFGKADYERAMELANPSPAQTRALVERLRQRRAELTRSREEKAARVRAFVHFADEQEIAEIVAELQAFDRQLGQIESSLDHALGLLGPGADRRAGRRGFEAARRIAEERLEQVRQALLRHLGAENAERIEVRSARGGEAQLEGGGRVWLMPRVRNQD